MDDYEDYSDYDDYDSGGDVFDEEDDYDDEEFYGDEDDGEEEEEEEEEEEGGEVEEEGQEEDEENEGGDQEEDEDAGDEMEDFEEEEEEITEIGEQYDDDEEIVGDQGVEIEGEAEDDEEEEEDLVEYEEEEEEEELMEEEEEELLEEEEEEELLEEEDEDEVYGDEGSYEDDADYENEILAEETYYVPRWTARAPIPSGMAFPRRQFHNVESGFSDLSEVGGGIGSSGSDRRRNETVVASRTTEVVASRGIESSGSNDSSLAGIQGTNCPICFERWTGEGEHCVCCLPCGHLYGLSCIKMWLQRPNSQKCPQCTAACELADVRRLYGLQLAINGVEELQQKVKCLEAKCASLELKDTDWLRKEATWQKREADLQEQLNQHKEAKTELPKDIRERPDPVDDPEPVNALRHMKL